VPAVRLVEVLAALSLTTDLASGMPFEKGLRVCLVADGLGDRLDLGPEERSDVFTTALLRSIGCTAQAPENAAEFRDDVSFQRVLKRLDLGSPEILSRQLLLLEDPALADHFLEIAPTTGPVAASAGCEVSRALAPGVHASPRAVAALDDVYERWDGLGIPEGRRADELRVEARILHVAEQAVLALLEGDESSAVQEVRRRAGGHLDPWIAAVFDDHAADIFAVLDTDDLLAEVIRRDPGPHQPVTSSDLGRLCGVLAMVADLKSVHLIGHSPHVAALVRAAAEASSWPEAAIAEVSVAALLHNLGCVVVPSSLLDRTRPPGAAGRERLRLQGYWTRRILDRCPSLREVEPVTRAAAEHHAAFAEGDFVTWVRAPDLPSHADSSPAARLLEAAEAYASWTEPRPGRPALGGTAAADHLLAASRAGLLDPGSVDAVLVASGQPHARTRPTPLLTPRELDVLELTARGLSNREIAVSLRISERTVGHHLAHVFDKTGRRSRAGVAVWAVERGLLPRSVGEL
jgi:HD-GYP domain-containing protein (c-di-GMP phosphodiesterase class II)